MGSGDFFYEALEVKSCFKWRQLIQKFVPLRSFGNNLIVRELGLYFHRLQVGVTIALSIKEKATTFQPLCALSLMTSTPNRI